MLMLMVCFVCARPPFEYVCPRLPFHVMSCRVFAWCWCLPLVDERAGPLVYLFSSSHALLARAVVFFVVVV